MPIKSIDGSGSNLPTSEPLQTRPPLSLEEHFVLKFQEIGRSFFGKKRLIEEGKVVEALNEKPSKVWDARTYQLALQSLGDSPILVNGSEIPASTHYGNLDRHKTFEGPLANSRYWEKIPAPQKNNQFDPVKLQMKRGVIPSEAFRSFSEGLRFLSSTAVIDLAAYLLFLERFGEERFNEVIREWEGIEPIRLGDEASYHQNKFMIRVASDVSAVFRKGLIFLLSHEEIRHLIYLRHNESDHALFTGFGLDPDGETIDKIGSGYLSLAYVLDVNEIERRFAPPPLTNRVTLKGEISIGEHFVHKMEELIRAPFERQSLIKQRRFKEAIEQEGIWSNRSYGPILKKLGRTEILFNGKKIAANQLHNILRESQSLYKPKGNPTYWQTVSKKDHVLNIDPIQLEMKRGVLASRAITSFQEGLSFLDCRSILCLARYLVLLERWGEERFNAIMQVWSEEAPIRLGDNGCPHQAKLIMLVKIEKTTLSLERIRNRPPRFYLGQLLYMQNRADYCQRNPHGPSPGLNLVYKGTNSRGEPLFIGLDLSPEGATPDEVAEWLFQEYNEPPVETEEVLPLAYVNRLNCFFFEINQKEESFTLEELYLGAEGKLPRMAHIPSGCFQNELLPHALEMMRQAKIHNRTPISRQAFYDGHSFFFEYDAYEVPNEFIG